MTQLAVSIFLGALLNKLTNHLRSMSEQSDLPATNSELLLNNTQTKADFKAQETFKMELKLPDSSNFYEEILPNLCLYYMHVYFVYEKHKSYLNQGLPNVRETGHMMSSVASKKAMFTVPPTKTCA